MSVRKVSIILTILEVLKSKDVLTSIDIATRLGTHRRGVSAPLSDIYWAVVEYGVIERIGSAGSRGMFMYVITDLYDFENMSDDDLLEIVTKYRNFRNITPTDLVNEYHMKCEETGANRLKAHRSGKPLQISHTQPSVSDKILSSAPTHRVKVPNSSVYQNSSLAISLEALKNSRDRAITPVEVASTCKLAVNTISAALFQLYCALAEYGAIERYAVIQENDKSAYGYHLTELFDSLRLTDVQICISARLYSGNRSSSRKLNRKNYSEKIAIGMRKLVEHREKNNSYPQQPAGVPENPTNCASPIAFRPLHEYSDKVVYENKAKLTDPPSEAGSEDIAVPPVTFSPLHAHLDNLRRGNTITPTKPTPENISEGTVDEKKKFLSEITDSELNSETQFKSKDGRKLTVVEVIGLMRHMAKRLREQGVKVNLSIEL